VSWRYGTQITLAGIVPSVGTVADAFDNDLAEITIGLYKTETMRTGSPSRNEPIGTLADVDDITSSWVHWYNTQRLRHRLGRIPPATADAQHFAQASAYNPVAALK